ncbi:unnamed protein product [Chrysoparadoxa australica]
MSAPEETAPNALAPEEEATGPLPVSQGTAETPVAEVEGAAMSEEAGRGATPSEVPTGVADPGAEGVEEGKEGEAQAGKEEEIHDYEEVVEDHNKALEEVRKKHAPDEDAAPITSTHDLENRLGYLMAQSEVFTHFIEGTADAPPPGGKKKRRLKESEEDSIMMKQSQSKARVTRLTVQPSSVTGLMRDYQLEGLNWMIKLHDFGINGILADEMGLGKTLQSISLLAFLKEQRKMAGPHLVIVPKSTVGNWMREFGRWCPALHVVKLLGDKATRKHVCETIIKPQKFEVVVTSYEGILKEKSYLQKIKWKYLMIDEAHRIKNEKSSLSVAVRALSSKFRLLITGTPLQNNLHELWALLNFLLPDVFHSADMFDNFFNVSGDQGAQDNVIKKLHTVLRPFMLRRVKVDVEKSLPPKTEVKLYIGLSAMQKLWYKKILSKDASSLNALGGPARTALLNVLMQLRKVCNHPYLFDGAEPGPPYINGPHLWENAGKMVLLNKLLPKLRDQGSRVLIFSQMTRLLDVLEDYMHIKGYDYCRIDGSTDGESRDRQMDEFNEEGSPKFCFLLSTRAGGLGINLATADTVILYDSDWNPQADLQAMDRAHRIGQTKPVKVFRFVTEGAVEEKIVERADRKLFLDAAVIQQGRLAEKHTQLSKNELMSMVKFGADAILRADDDTGLTDEDIDELLRRGEERTNAQKDKIQKDAQHSLANFSLLGADETEASSFYDFEGQDYKKKQNSGMLINLPSRERKRTYEALAKAEGGPRRKKGITMHDFQFFNRAAVEVIQDKEQDFAIQKSLHNTAIKERRAQAKKLASDVKELEMEAQQLEAQLPKFELTPKEAKEKAQLIAEAFGDWTRKDFRAFIAAMERNGREDVDAIVKEVCMETGKKEDNVRRYYKASASRRTGTRQPGVFWQRYQELGDVNKYLERIQRGERRIQRSQEIRAALAAKVERHKNPLQNLSINYGGNKGKVFTEDEDAFLVNMMHQYGYGNWEAIRVEIRKAWQFRFDWFFKSRNAAELQRRGDILIRLVEKENEELGKKKKGGTSGKRKSVGGGGASKKKSRR